MPRPQFSLKTLLWVLMLTSAGAGLVGHFLRHQGVEFGIIPWLAIGAVVGGFVGLFVHEPMAFLFAGVGVALLLALLAFAIAIVAALL